MYDLDRTEAWLQRTRQLPRRVTPGGPPAGASVRRRDAAVAVGAAATTLAIVLLLRALLVPVEPAVAAYRDRARIERAPAGRTPARLTQDARAHSGGPSEPPILSTWPGPIEWFVPPPGHVPPPAPTWLDGSRP